jgi:protein-arginine kinase activator protein McsA
MDRFNFNKFNRLFDDFFSRNEFFNFDQFLTGDNNLEKRVYTNEDGSVNVVYIKNGKNRNEIDGLKQKLDMAIENQEFELAVELRDKIQNLEQNQEEIKKLNDELKNHIQNQDFEKCIELRDKIKSLK